MTIKNIIFILFVIVSIFRSNAEDILTTSFVSKPKIDSVPIRAYMTTPIWTKSKLNVYVNNKIYKKSIYPINDFIYLSDTLQSNDRIKVKVSGDKIFKSKTYKFKYSKAQNIVIRIKIKQRLFPGKRGGCGGNFW